MKFFAIILALLCCFLSTPAHSQDEWTFAVSGDSRNCGDIVMPAIAARARQQHAAFYWHLGDFRAIYDFDQDYKQLHPNVNIFAYENDAWADFIEHQLAPFADTPVYLALGNHETISPKNRAEAIQAFADWFDDPLLKAQRLADNPANHKLQAYYHWIKGPVDFITLDNSTDDMFDEAQLVWFEAELKTAATNPKIRTVVLGMHRALPDSLSTGHSMSETAQGTVSGRRVYKDLLNFRSTTHKNVYVLASHSHFYMANVYNTACRRLHPETILPGWIVGTAGAVRYTLPKDLTGAESPQNDLYGYLLGRVKADGTIQFAFHPIEKQLNAIPDSVRKLYTDSFVEKCLNENHSPYQPDGPPQPPACPE
jgi:Calcineurin-like phosphoesterase